MPGDRRRRGRRGLVEASPRDRIWGIGLTASDPRAFSPSARLGANLLGFALVEGGAGSR
ncbi:NADAR domain-containing protein [Sinosporangium album]|uniref:NADAR domain-containing protein n=1 Tax=Sinosporangium album TaxID=504805 RepID=UPI000B2E3104|nr:NADAR domain-containing protein [Sinosporangium album]